MASQEQLSSRDSSRHEVPAGTSILLSLRFRSSHSVAQNDQVEVYVVDSSKPFLETLPSSIRLLLPRYPPAEPFKISESTKNGSDEAVGSLLTNVVGRKRRKLDATTVDLFSAISEDCVNHVRRQISRLPDLADAWALHHQVEVCDTAPRHLNGLETQAVHGADISHFAGGNVASIDWPWVEHRGMRTLVEDVGIKKSKPDLANLLVRSGDDEIPARHVLVVNESLDSPRTFVIAINDATFDLGETPQAARERRTQPRILLPCRSGFLLTNLLESQSVMPPGFSKLLNFGASQRKPVHRRSDTLADTCGAPNLLPRGNRCSP